ncbi:MAG TPA: hypothetical protein VKI43_12880, partial [Vicinamibacterales bacterium]|nr:hypothetical protein [Vicinamibacterales bacterium]
MAAPLRAPVTIAPAAARYGAEIRIALVALAFRLVSSFIALCVNLAFPLDRNLPDQSTMWG